ncbi:AAA family ATPase [Mycoplasmopsis edwardii]|uniref:Dephospho-CoA kinase n=1 Tax=Mycoplasmopsis edwardii TaxID=53558 RepID=A0ACD4PHY3_9BACT|nr:dephospho-CoA kinase [Mycoplasmopsis edwardii]WBP83755.1 dephospho-CoA kinase [Mycoplasmopsis edwardii]
MIAIVGKIASGKTRLLNELKQLGHKVFEADYFVSKLYNDPKFALEVAKKVSLDLVSDSKVLKDKIKNELLNNSDAFIKLENLVIDKVLEHLEANYYHFVELPILFKMNKVQTKSIQEIWFLDIDESKRQEYLKTKHIDKAILSTLDAKNNYIWSQTNNFNGIKVVNILVDKDRKNKEISKYNCHCQINI